jgi:SNF2 family DNA or RNA helicase
MIEKDLYSGEDRRYIKHHIVLTTYDMIPRDLSMFQRIRWETLIVDEGHRLKERKSKLYGALMGLKSVRWKLLLTGTPLQNNLRECLNILHFLDAEQFHNIDELEEKFETLDKSKVDELHEILRERVLRRTKKAVLGDVIPDRFEVIIPVTITPLQRSLYSKLLARNFTHLKTSERNSVYARKTSLTNVLMELRKLLNHPYLIQGSYEAAIDPETEHKLLYESSGKLLLLHHLLKKLKSRGSRVLIFSTMTRMLDILEVSSLLEPILLMVAS